MASLDGKLYANDNENMEYILYIDDEANSDLLKTHHRNLDLGRLVGKSPVGSIYETPTEVKTVPTLFTRSGGQYETNVKTIFDTLSRIALPGKSDPYIPTYNLRYTDYVLYIPDDDHNRDFVRSLADERRSRVSVHEVTGRGRRAPCIEGVAVASITLFTRDGGHSETNYAAILKTLRDLPCEEEDIAAVEEASPPVDESPPGEVASILKKAACDLIDTATLPTLRKIIDNLTCNMPGRK